MYVYQKSWLNIGIQKSIGFPYKVKCSSIQQLRGAKFNKKIEQLGIKSAKLGKKQEKWETFIMDGP